MRVLWIALVAAAWAQTAAPPSVPARKAEPLHPKSSTQPSAPSTRNGGSKPPTSAPDPDEGSLDENGVYTSDFFRFTYTLPEGFQVDEEFLADLEDQTNSTFMLLAAQGPLSGEDRRNVVVIMADKDATTADAYVDKVTRDYAQKQQFEVVKAAYPVTVAGKPFYRADFRKEGTYQTAVFTVLKGYAVGFSLAAPGVDAMNILIESLNTVKFLSPAAPSKPVSQKPSAPAMKKPTPK